eukprot:jgi/Mesen1/11074/ME000099S10508
MAALQCAQTASISISSCICRATTHSHSQGRQVVLATSHSRNLQTFIGLRNQLTLSQSASALSNASRFTNLRSANGHTITMGLKGADPEWLDDDYICLGLAHCFVKDDNGKLKDVFVIEPIPAGALECMDNGGVTCFKHVTATNLGVALKMDSSLLPAEFADGKFADDFDYRTKCASRTWKRQHPQENLMNLAPKEGVRSDWNFSLEDKRVLNMVYEVSDSDNIKQDISIDVYGRADEEVALPPSKDDKEIEKLYNV